MADSIPESDSPPRSDFAGRHGKLFETLRQHPSWTAAHEAQLEDLVAWVEREKLPIPAAIEVREPAPGIDPGHEGAPPLVVPLWGDLRDLRRGRRLKDRAAILEEQREEGVRRAQQEGFYVSRRKKQGLR